MADPTPKRRRRGHPYSPRARVHPGLSLLPVVTQLAEDAWLLAQKSPALPADPALVETAARLLGELRRNLRREPECRVLPQFPPGIRLHALALGLRQLQVVLERLADRDRPGGDAIDTLVSLNALYLRDLALAALERRGVALPQDIRHLRHLRRAPPDDDSGEVIPAHPGLD